MPLLDSFLPHTVWHPCHKHAESPGVQELVLALVDDGSGQTVVHSQGEVLSHAEDLDPVELAVGDQFVAEHGADGVVAHVVRHPNE